MKLLYKKVVRDGLQKQFSEGGFDMMQGSGDGGWKSFKKGVDKKWVDKKLVGEGGYSPKKDWFLYFKHLEIYINVINNSINEISKRYFNFPLALFS